MIELAPDLASKACQLTLFGHAFEIAALIYMQHYESATPGDAFVARTAFGVSLTSVLCLDFVRINGSSDIVLLDHYSVEIDKCFGDHVKPFVRKSLGFVLKSISQEPSPSQDLL